MFADQAQNMKPLISMTQVKKQRFYLSFARLSIIYFFISTFLVRAYPSPAVKILVTSVSIVLIPLVVGKSIIAIIFKNHRNDYFSPVSSNVIEWIAGNLIIYFAAAILFSLGIMDSQIFAYLIIALPSAYLFLTEFRRRDVSEEHSTTHSINNIFGNKYAIPIVFLAGLLPLFYLVPILPFPLSPTQTGGRLRLSLQFIESGYVELVRGYSSLLSPIHSISAIIYDMHPLEVLSATAYISHIIFPFALYLLCYKITKDSLLSLIPAFIGPWIFLGGSMNLTALENSNLLFLIFTWMLYVGLDLRISLPLNREVFSKPLFLLSFAIVFLSPITYFVGKGGRIIPPAYFIFLSIFLPAILIGVYYALSIRNPRRIGSLLTFVIPFMLINILHPYLGPLVIFFLVCFFYASSASEGQRMYGMLRWVPVALTSVVLILVIFQISGPDNFLLSRLVIGDALKGTGLNVNVQQKWDILVGEGPAFAFYLFVISVLLIGMFGHKKYVPFAFTSSVILFLSFLPEGNLWRSQSYLNPLAAIVLTYSFTVVWGLVEAHTKHLRSRISDSPIFHQSRQHTTLGILRHTTERVSMKLQRLKRINYLPKLVLVALTIIVLLPVVQIPREEYFKNALATSGEGYYSHFQTYDITASFWILDNFRTESVLVISDPATMYFVGSLTTKDTLMTQYIDPYYPWEYGSETWNYMEHLKQSVFLSLGKEDSYKRVQEVAGIIYPEVKNYNKILFVITPHTYYWLYENLTFPTRVKSRPIDFCARTLLRNLENDNDFSLIFQTDRLVYIYELKLPEK